MPALRATYRLQFGPRFTFRDATAALPYLASLGISHVYASPLLTPRPGSPHGYDVVDPWRLNPELGSAEDFERFAEGLKRHGLGLLLDVVPNHLCASAPANRWWTDVLRFGIASPHVRFFDIDFHPAKSDLRHRLLLPILGCSYGEALESGQIGLALQGAEPVVRVPGHELPLTPASWPQLFGPLLREPSAWNAPLQELSYALEELPLPADHPKGDGYRRQVLELTARVAVLLEGHSGFRDALERELRALQGRPGDPPSFDRLEALLERQVYRLSFWRVAADEINYRRFFDVNELVAVQVEEPEVFDALHAVPFRLIERGIVDALRVDHVDGLSYPGRYLQELQREAARRRPEGSAPFPLYVEKILGHQEPLDPAWPVAGTTGYDALNLISGLFIEPTGLERIRSFYESFTQHREPAADAIYPCKQLILQSSLAAELHLLALRLDRLSERHRSTRDFTLNSLERALQEVIAAFPVYRTYLSGPLDEIRPADRDAIQSAIALAKWRNRSTSPSIFNFIQSVLLLERGASADDDRALRFDFVRRFQQLTGPVMAKGLEDTAFYRHVPLASLCEVGGDLARGLNSPEEFHQANLERLRAWPDTMIATTTHDTKRTEDARARLNALTELPGRWESSVLHWSAINRTLKPSVDGHFAPDRNEEYLVYQLLLAGAPADGQIDAACLDRFQAVLEKALREAKVHTSWISPYALYEQSCRQFLDGIFAPGHAFRDLFAEFLRELERPALRQSLGQLLLKLCCPGVPDLYQGSETMDYRLADPDNRQPVDLSVPAAALGRLEAAPVPPLPGGADDLKLRVIQRALDFRRRRPELFARGDYLPLRAAAPHDRSVVAFARRHPGSLALAAVLRFTEPSRVHDGLLPLPLELEAEAFRDLIGGRELRAQRREGRWSLALRDLFESLPVALLEAI